MVVGSWDLITGLHQQVRRTLRRYGLCPPGSRLLVGLSGGSDSVALTNLLLDLSEHGGFSIAGVGHLNHQLRPLAHRDETFCREFAGRLGLQIVVETADIQTYAQSRGLSVEDAARRIRYSFLEQAAGAVGADLIAVGHTQDDQAETFLLKLMRGAGLPGLAGIYPRRGQVIRPLLEVTRAELRAYLVGRGVTWVDDETNDDVGNPRNRIRHRVLPELDRAAGGATRPAIARAAALIRDDSEWLEELSRERFRSVVTQTGTGLALDLLGLAEVPPPILRRVLLQAMREAAGGREIGLEHVEAVVAVLRGLQGGVDVPGSRVELCGEKLVLIQQKAAVR